MSVTERDMGWGKFLKQLEKVSESPGVKVGVLADAGTTDDGADLLLIAAANELGTGDGRIPPRPFIRGAFDEKQAELFRTQERLWNLVKAGRIDIDRALGLLGEEHQGQVQEYMTALSEPRNADSTIKRKGSSNPLIDEGRLRASIRWERT